MQPQSLLGQMSASMGSGQSPLNSISSSSPAGDPTLQPPAASPMPQGSPASLIKAAQGRGMDLSQHPQLQSQPQMPQQPMQTPQPSPGDGQVEMPVTEAELLIKALSGRLKTISGHEEKLRDAAINVLTPQVADASTPQ